MLHNAFIFFSYEDFVMVDAWEVEQPQYTRTLHVLQHLKRRLMELFEGENNIQTIPQGCPPTAEPRTVLVCGADVLQSMADASIWKQDLLEVYYLVLHSFIL